MHSPLRDAKIRCDGSTQGSLALLTAAEMAAACRAAGRHRRHPPLRSCPLARQEQASRRQAGWSRSAGSQTGRRVVIGGIPAAPNGAFFGEGARSCAGSRVVRARQAELGGGVGYEPKHWGSLAALCEIPSCRLQPENGWPEMQISRRLLMAAQGAAARVVQEAGTAFSQYSTAASDAAWHAGSTRHKRGQHKTWHDTATSWRASTTRAWTCQTSGADHALRAFSGRAPADHTAFPAAREEHGPWAQRAARSGIGDAGGSLEQARNPRDIRLLCEPRGEPDHGGLDNGPGSWRCARCTSTGHTDASAAANMPTQATLDAGLNLNALPGCLCTGCTMLSREARRLLGILACCGSPARAATWGKARCLKPHKDGGAKAGVARSCGPLDGWNAFRWTL
ncbi:hypothetical protein SVAN01_11049 [Stagonosporopsis vannaccii]|nr:hypothetical protein SVAN01_11049 [Stagonosporopsis vannaccii]